MDSGPIDRFLWANLPFGVRKNGSEPFRPSAYMTDYLADEAVRAIAANRNRPGDWKLQLSERPRKAWLFDLASDPTERVNLASAEPARVAELTALLDAHDAEQSAPLWPSLLEGAIQIDPPLGASHRPDDEFVYWAN